MLGPPSEHPSPSRTHASAGLWPPPHPSPPGCTDVLSGALCPRLGLSLQHREGLVRSQGCGQGCSPIWLPGSPLSCPRAVVPADSALSLQGHQKVLMCLWPNYSAVPQGGLRTAPTFVCPVPGRPRSHHKARRFSPTEGRFWPARSRRDAHRNRGRASQPQPPGWWGPRPWSPEGDALLLVGLADAVVAVAIHPLAWVPVVQVHVGRAVRTGPRAELREVAGIAGVPTRGSRRLQLQGQGGL